MKHALNGAGELIELSPVSEGDRARGKARRTERNRHRSWAERKAQAHTALSATDYLMLSDRRSITDAEKAYREALRVIIRAEPSGAVPDLPTL